MAGMVPFAWDDPFALDDQLSDLFADLGDAVPVKYDAEETMLAFE